MTSGKLPVVLLMAVAVAVLPYLPAEARYLPTRGNDDRLTRLKELLTDLLESGAQPAFEMERPYADSIGAVAGDYNSRPSLRPRDYTGISEKSIMELFNLTSVHRSQRPRS
ncbi:Hypothetical protein CINCED_3A006123 [Cinara cedri]|uniref:Uncharacterized protein n=1 Tax=Cinara cedri TaxID=506608 RepID=A0A5E4MF85_9HEMI|nr:Hypothetical protein CINCED_3A006123 [Cinara cedri]